jgi:excisionase family DNA binding protein
MTKPVTVDKLLYTPVEAAHALGLSRSTIYVLMANGQVPSVRIGNSRRVPAEGLRRYVAMLADKAAGGQSRAGADDGAGQQHLWK